MLALLRVIICGNTDSFSTTNRCQATPCLPSSFRSSKYNLCVLTSSHFLVITQISISCRIRRKITMRLRFCFIVVKTGISILDSRIRFSIFPAEILWSCKLHSFLREPSSVPQIGLLPCQENPKPGNPVVLQVSNADKFVAERSGSLALFTPPETETGKRSGPTNSEYSVRNGSESVSRITSIDALLSVRSVCGRQGTAAGEQQARIAHGHPPNQSERSGRGTRYCFPRVYLLRAGR